MCEIRVFVTNLGAYNSGRLQGEMETIEYQGKMLRLETPAQIEEYCGGVAFFAFARDEDGRRYTVRWDYVEPDWYANLSPEEKTSLNDLSVFADWNHPAEVEED